MKSNYINANFLSTIITAGCVVEGTLFRQVVFCDPEKRQQHHGLHGVFDLTMKYAVISEDVTDVFDFLDDIRDLRNGVVHSREGHKDDALITQHHFDNIMDSHPNKYGKEYAEKMLKVMFDIKVKYNENQRQFWNQGGPLMQGMNTIKTGKEAYCDHCGTALKEIEFDYEIE